MRDWLATEMALAPKTNSPAPLAVRMKPALRREAAPAMPSVEEKKGVADQAAPLPLDGEIAEMRRLVTTAAPHWRFRRAAPDDRLARQRAAAWGEKVNRSPLIILCNQERPAVEEMLARLQQAMQQFAPTSIVEVQQWERAKLWDPFLASPTLRLILLSAEILEACPNLKPFLMKKGQTVELGNKPAMLVASWQQFVSDRMAKRWLWKTIQALWSGINPS
jgi:hypothetical protein